jgi:hypothetical protein
VHPEFEDQLWRLQNLYSCRREGDGVGLPFTPRPEQLQLFRHLIETPHIPAYIIKSRRLGISTAIDTFAADCTAFRQSFRGIVIDKTQGDATKKMVEIVRFAVDSLPPEILRRFVFDKRNDSELRLRWPGEPESQDSVVYATTGGRGGDCSMLHVSEWGPIAAMDPTRSSEIRTGAFPAARKAIRVVETTWMGGKHGDLWELVKPVLEKDPNAEGIFYFFPWHSDPQAVRVDGMVPEEIETYFRELGGKLGATFSQEQKKWYVAKKLEQGIFVKREYPSTLDEALSSPMAGAIYAEQIDAARAAGRIRPFEWDRSTPVFSTWDVGWADSTSIWLFQVVGRDVHWIWHTRQAHRTAAEMVQSLRETEIPVATHLLPHDAAKKSPDEGQTYKDKLTKAGLINIKVVPRCVSRGPGINDARALLARSWFRLPYCQEGIEALEAYHMRENNAGGVTVQDPVHDWSSHDADAVRIAAEAMELGMVEGAAARRIMDNIPKFPDGSMVDPEEARRIRQQRRGRAAMALSGPRRL